MNTSAPETSPSSEGNVVAQRVRRPAWLGYLLVIVLEIAATALLRMLQPLLPGTESRIPFILITAAAAYLCGLGAALLSILLGTLAYDSVYVAPPGTQWGMPGSADDWAGFAVLFIGMGLVIPPMLAIRSLTMRLSGALGEVEARESLLRTVLETVPVGVVFADADGSINYWSQGASRILGGPAGGITGRPGPGEVRLLKPDGSPSPAEDMPLVRSSRLGEPVYGVRMLVRRPDGSEAVILADASPVYDEHGAVEGAVGSLTDITQLMQAEEALTRALAEAQRDRRFVAAMESVSEAALRAGPLPEVLKEIAYRIREGMGTHSSTIFLLHPESDELEAVAACGIPEKIGFRIPVGRGFIGKIAGKKATVYVRDAEHDPLVESPHLKRAGVKSLLGTPLWGPRAIMGIIYVDEMAVREFSHEERRLLETFASRIALVVENARLLEDLHRNFLLLQRALIPPAPQEITGYELASSYRPGAGGAEIGGDFYDVFPTESGKVGIVIGDVVGKGIPSASLAASTRSTLRAFIYESSSPREALTHTNAVIGPEKDDPALFVTVLAAVIDPGSGRICYASAGHPPPAICRVASCQVEFLESDNPPVGVLDDAIYREREALLAGGDKILFYTDGLEEARRGPVLFGPAGIERVLKEQCGLPPDQILTALVDAALDWAGGTLNDDVAVIVISRSQDG